MRLLGMGQQAPTAHDAEYEKFVHTQVTGLLSLAGRLTASTGDAEELVQDTLVRAYSKWHLVRQADRPDAYVRRMMLNRHISLGRRRGALALEAADLERTSQPTAPPGLEERDAMLYALKRLPDRQRVALILRYYLDLDDAESAAIMKCRSSTVRSAVMRGLRSLREVYSEQNEEPWIKNS